MSVRDVSLLLVDDDPSAIQLMSRMLAQYPDQRFATSGEDALRLARESTPDLIVLDAEMPGMTGFDVCDILKADPVLAPVPVIFATSLDTTSHQLSALGQGAADFITKPLVGSQLTARVRAHLRARALLEESKRDGLSVPPRRPEGSAAQAARLLIVDDDVVAIRILRNSLGEIGDFHFAKSGEEALELAARITPDLILLDAHMSGVDGFEVCEQLKALPRFRHVPIVFVTRFCDPLSETRALDLGAADFIAKPYTPAVLQARVRNLLALKRRGDEELRSLGEHWRRVSDSRVADIVGAASDAIVTQDASGNVVLINAAACKMFGITQERASGTPASALFGADIGALAPARPGPLRLLLAPGTEGGAQFPVEVSVSQVGSGGARLTTVMLRDIGNRERLEAESRARAEAEAASRAKTLMLAYIAHEMGNPLNGLIGFAELMATDTAHPLPAAQATRLAHIATSGQRLRALMRDLVDLGGIESGQLAIDAQAVDLGRCIEAAAASLAALAHKAGVTVHCPLQPQQPLFVRADPERLDQCLVNLLSNAIKYNRPGGQVEIEIELDGAARSVAIALRDNGIGMSVAQRMQLFEPFNRLGRERVKASGFGLGLVITRRLVEAMRGSLAVDSEPDVGSRFTITLPLCAESGN